MRSRTRQLALANRGIGQPGDTIEVRHKQIYVNGEKIDDPYGRFVDGPGDQSRLTPRDNYGPVTAPPDKVFVMGDNRDRSYDSRFWGFVPLDDVRGKAFMIYWSWNGEDRWVRWERIGNLMSDREHTAFLEQAARDPGLEEVLADAQMVLYRVKRDGPPPVYPTGIE